MNREALEHPDLKADRGDLKIINAVTKYIGPDYYRDCVA